MPEDRLTGAGRMILVRFVVIPATGPDKAPDPVVWFAGGPGDSAVNDIPGELSSLGDLGAHRDLVFIEQRSTGESNPLTCPPFPGLADKAALRAGVRSCLAHLRGDLRFYTTAMYADDVNQVLGDLHYATANFVGISYGTIAEQVFLLRHPGRVRTMTLISGSPLNIPVYQRAPGNSQLVLDYVFALCARQLACHQAFPQLAADWAALWASVGTSPWVVPAAQSPAKTTMRLDQDGLADLAYQTLFTGDIGPIPVVVHTLAAARNKAAAIISVAKAFPAGPSGGGANQMLFYAFRCDEPWASAPPAALSGQRGSFAYHTDLELGGGPDGHQESHAGSSRSGDLEPAPGPDLLNRLLAGTLPAVGRSTRVDMRGPVIGDLRHLGLLDIQPYLRLGGSDALWYQDVCPLIPKSAAAVGDAQLTVSTVPVLTFNGAYDPIEQPRNWAGAQEFFPGSRDIALPGQGHDTNASWGACAGPLTQAFIEQASAAHLNTSCLAAAPAPAFDLTLP